MELIAGLLVVIGVCFGGVLLYGAPYLPTLHSQIEAALDLADLKAGQTLLELGCGDGKVLIAAAERGLTVVGYELNPFLALLAWVRTRRYGRRVTVVCGNFWSAEWPPADAIFVFLLDRFMTRLDNKIAIQYRSSIKRPVKLVSFAFQIPNKQPDGRQGGVYLYRYV